MCSWFIESINILESSIKETTSIGAGTATMLL
jgi:hypothetical protein